MKTQETRFGTNLSAANRDYWNVDKPIGDKYYLGDLERLNLKNG
jgi:hypothetical protein